VAFFHLKKKNLDAHSIKLIFETLHSCILCVTFLCPVHLPEDGGTMSKRVAEVIGKLCYQ